MNRSTAVPFWYSIKGGGGVKQTRCGAGRQTYKTQGEFGSIEIATKVQFNREKVECNSMFNSALDEYSKKKVKKKLNKEIQQCTFT